MPESDTVPQHIAIIMDGNGRWARQRRLARTRGHQEGAKSVQAIVEECIKLGVKYLTLYAFSVENWKRPEQETGFLMLLLERYLAQQRVRLMRDNVVLDAIGRLDGLPKRVRAQLERTIAETRNNTGLRVCMALNYGGRAEIVDAARALAEDVRLGTVQPESINEELFAGYLYRDADGRTFPDPDLLIRTAGEMRLSNFLLWQVSYAELYVTKVCWPDFKGEQIREAVDVYRSRVRKFGGLKESDDVRDTVVHNAGADSTAAVNHSD